MLLDGESLYVSVEMVGDPDAARLCLAACLDEYEEDRNYWSNATDAPYAWVTLASFGTLADLDVSAVGTCEGAGCAPGTAATGEACTTNDDCSSVGADSLCIAEQWIPAATGGYCTEYCDPEVPDCADGAVCVASPPGGTALGICRASCATIDDCRDGYDCVEFAEGLACAVGG